MELTTKQIQAAVDAYMKVNGPRLDAQAKRSVERGLKANNSAIKADDPPSKEADFRFGPITTGLDSQLAADKRFKDRLTASIFQRLDKTLKGKARVEKIVIKDFPDGNNKSSLHPLILLK